MSKAKCILLMSAHHPLADAAENFTRLFFDVRYVTRRARRDDAFPTELREFVEAEPADYLFNFLCSIILPDDLLNAIGKAAINFHPAPPRWPGVGSASYALYHQDTSFGVTAHLMKKQLDSGEILKVLRFPIFPQDTCESLFERTLQYALILYYDLVGLIARGETLPSSDEKWERKAIRRREFEQWMTLVPSDPPEEMQRKIRATRHGKYPGPYLQLGAHRFELPPGRGD